MVSRYSVRAISLVMVLLSVGIHALTRTEEKHIKVGFLFVGDEITPYTENFIKARNHVMEVYGDQIECVTKYNVTEDQISEPLQELVKEKCDYIASIPMKGDIDSLNASVAAGVLAFEIVRQRNA